MPPQRCSTGRPMAPLRLGSVFLLVLGPFAVLSVDATPPPPELAPASPPYSGDEGPEESVTVLGAGSNRQTVMGIIGGIV